MLRANIKKNGNITNQGIFPDMTKIEEWILFNKFRVFNTEVYEFDLHKWGYDKNNMPQDIEFELVTGGDNNQYKLYTLPPTQTLEIIDMTSEIQTENEQKESKESFELVQALKAYIRWLNKKKMRDGLWTNETFLAFIQSSTIANAERALNQASWATYKGLVLQAGAFYSSNEMQYIIGMVEQHELKWQSVLGG